MQKHKFNWYKKGIRDGVPIALGYFAVSFALGIAAKQAGFNAFQAALTSFLINASAGEFAGFTLISAGASYIEVAVMELVANARYLLMSTALSQKLPPDTPLRHRMLVGFDVTDEIFGISMAVDGDLCPWYNYGAMTVAIPGWSIGTMLGVIMGNVLPASVVSALGVGLYGMFIAIIIPPARKEKVIAGVVAVSFAASFAAAKLPLINRMPSGIKTIALTVIIALAAALIFPVKDEEGADK